MHPFHITIGPRGAPRLAFEAMAVDACSAAAQHADLAEVGERVEVTPAQRMRAELQQLADQIKAKSASAWLPKPAEQPAIKPVAPAPTYSSAYRSCCLCGEPCETFTCNRCARRSRSL